MTIQITIVGLGQFGTSVGLALSKHANQLHRVGNDAEPARVQKAKNMGALDKITYNLPKAVSKADIVLLSVPMNEVEKTLHLIAPELKEGAVVLDMSAVKMPVIAWAQEYLPAERHLVGLTPVLNPLYLHETTSGQEAAHEDLFKNGLMLIVTPPGTVDAVLKLAVDFTHLLDAAPMFADASEVDGIMASSDLLPQLLAAALTQFTSNQAGWQDSRKMTGRPYAIATSPLALDLPAESLGLAALLNQENLLRVIDHFIASLLTFRKCLEDKDEKELVGWLSEAYERREKWWAQRRTGEWKSEELPRDYPTLRERLGMLVGLGRKESKEEG
ncbi:MAG: prephenate dehydrogenase/arogenate dehydrogenase family protein [Chloroflexota bacterium]